MVEGVGPEVVKQGLMSADAWNRGIVALYRTAEPDGVFCYTFFKATARKEAHENRMMFSVPHTFASCAR
ncbi:MAG: hypothetical protein WC620_04480 [Methanoregula sp.]|jgi:hypothetical protein